jgi:hypothetical protein
VRDPRAGLHFGGSAVIGRLRDIALVLDGRNALFQRRVVRVGNAAFNRRIEAAETAFGVREFCLERREPPIRPENAGSHCRQARDGSYAPISASSGRCYNLRL